MKKVTVKTVANFWNSEDIKISNSEVKSNYETVSYYLFGNRIAQWYKKDSSLEFTHCGWLTATTKERLNGILFSLGYKIFQKRGRWFINTPKDETLEFKNYNKIDL